LSLLLLPHLLKPLHHLRSTVVAARLPLGLLLLPHLLEALHLRLLLPLGPLPSSSVTTSIATIATPAAALGRKIASYSN
jgi:hypothetical protein